MIKKGLALEAAGLREDELELEVPPDLVAGRLGGAHFSPTDLWESPRLAARVDLWAQEAAVSWGCPAARPGLAFSLCLSETSVSLAGRCVWPPVASYVFAPAARCAS